MTAGKVLTIIADRNEVIKRMCISVENCVYFVCTVEEYMSSQLERRDPVCIGFRREYILSEEEAA
jgi:hypothetical protein